MQSEELVHSPSEVRAFTRPSLSDHHTCVIARRQGCLHKFGERTCVTCALTQGGLHTSCGIVLTIPTGRVDCYRWVVQWPMHSGFKGSE